MNNTDKQIEPLSHAPSPMNPQATRSPYWSLRAKFSVFISLLIMLVCSGLSVLLIQQELTMMEKALINTGTMLVKTINKVSTNRVIIQDKEYLETMLDGALSAPEVIYAIARDQDGKVLVGKSKGILPKSSHGIRNETIPLFPNDTLTDSFFSQPFLKTSAQPKISVWNLASSQSEKSKLTLSQLSPVERKDITKETLYDFSLPVFRQTPRSPALELLSSESLEPSSNPVTTQPKIMGLIQVGLTTTYMQKDLNRTVLKSMLFTLAIILIGIVLTLMLANHIVTPLQRLARAAKRFSDGEPYSEVSSDAKDEVGQLTQSINTMAMTLQQREESITTFVDTITRQLNHLSTLHQTGTIITSTLDVHKLFATVLKLLQENLGFQRMVLVLKDSANNKGILSEVSGFSIERETQIKGFEFIIEPDSIDEILLIQGQPILVHDLDDIRDKMKEDILALGRQIGILSFVSAPLISHGKVLGYVGAEKGQTRCTEEDLNLLMTIASHVAVAIDNARTYQDLEKLAADLEQRVFERTRDLQAANDRLQELDSLKSAFVSIVSHELRTPMTSIKGLIENMIDGLTGTLNERQSFYLSRVNHNIERLTRMINDLLDLSRIEAGHMELEATAIHPDNIAREVVELLQPIAKEQSLTLITNIINPIPQIHGDRDKLIQIFTNLTNNALKFTPPTGTVIVEMSYKGDEKIHVSVSDTGCGIDPNEHQTIFERFYRSHADDLKNRGAGLGLAITKSLVELHGGTIGVESVVNQGSQFWFTLPIYPSNIEEG